MKVLKVGSIKVYQAEDSPKARNILFSEPLLWFLRSLIVLILAFILVEPFLNIKRDTQSELTKNLILVEPDLWPKLQYQLKDSSVQYLSNGFPLTDFELVDQTNSSNYWDLLYQLSEKENPPQKIKVFTQALPKNFRGSIPKLNFELEWIIINDVESSQIPIKAWYIGDSLLLVNADFEPQIVRLTPSWISSTGSQSLGQSIKIEDEQILNVSIIAKSQDKYEVDNFIEALKSLEKFTTLKFRLTQDSIWNDSNTSDWIFSFNDTPFSSFNFSGNLVWRSPSSKGYQWFDFVADSNNNHYEMNGRVLEVNQGEEKLSKLPEALIQLFYPSSDIEEALINIDPRPVSLTDSKNNLKPITTLGQTQTEFSLINLLWLMLLAVLTAERMISANKSQ